MFYDEPDEIITKAQRALSEWTWLAAIADRPDHLVEMLNRQARSLAGVAYEHPERAVTILELIDGYRDLALQVEGTRYPAIRT